MLTMLKRDRYISCTFKLVSLLRFFDRRFHAQQYEAQGNADESEGAHDRHDGENLGRNIACTGCRATSSSAGNHTASKDCARIVAAKACSVLHCETPRPIMFSLSVLKPPNAFNLLTCLILLLPPRLLLPLLPGAATAAVTGAAKDANELTEMLAIFPSLS